MPDPCEKRYTGIRHNPRNHVTVERIDRDPNGGIAIIETRRLENIRDQSPVGFDWGYHGFAPDDLAHAILHDHFGSDGHATKFSEDMYHEFADRVIANLPHQTWTLDTARINETLSLIQRDHTPAAVCKVGASA